MFGRNWLRSILLDWGELFKINSIRVAHSHTAFAHLPAAPAGSPTSLQDVLENHSELFKPGLGCYTGPPVNFEMKRQGKFHKARPVPYALQPKVEAALLKMEADGIIKRISSCDSAAPIVPVLKKNTNEVRICGDFSVTFNSCADVIHYPIPKIHDLHAALRGGKVFSVLDMSQAYHQVPISEESQKNT